VVARDRNIPIIVNVAGAAVIQPRDRLQMDAATGIIHVNGGDPDFQAGEVVVAEEPIYAFVWSGGQGDYRAIEPGSEGAVATHQEMVMAGMAEGWFDMADNAMGVVYEDGKVELFSYPSDQEAMVQWLNTIHPVSHIE
jgi:hypothetical protein